MLKRFEDLLHAEVDGQPDIDTIMKVSEMIVNMKGWTAAERHRTASLLEQIISRGFSYKEKMEQLRHGKGGGVSISISKEALDELEGI